MKTPGEIVILVSLPGSVHKQSIAKRLFGPPIWELRGEIGCVTTAAASEKLAAGISLCFTSTPLGLERKSTKSFVESLRTAGFTVTRMDVSPLGSPKVFPKEAPL